jgi:cellulose synthase/poly-beta-1,6-N-acetylglucosamine synthase-like glycosyltransferase
LTGAAPSEPAPGPALGVIVPCRNEAAVLPRKLRNLAACDWPPGRHRIVVVDDGSDDGTAALAERLGRELFGAPGAPVTLRVVPNSDAPGKTGAIRSALRELGEAEVLVLTDADVVLRPPSLAALAAAFRARPELGLACGRQEFVRDLGDDGSCRGADGGPPRPAAEAYDRWTARVRAWESRRGRLFSVHGQLLAWPARLALSPAPGIAADDLDLMFQVRDRGLRVELLPQAAFLEVKPPAGASRAEWQRRRARAWFQVMADRASPPGAPVFDRLQLLAYRLVHHAASPAAHVAGGLGLLALAAGVALLLRGPGVPWTSAARTGLAVGGALLLLLIVSPLGRGARALTTQWTAIRAARAAGAARADRWDTPRS